MDRLEEATKELRAADRELALAFAKRMRAGVRVAACRREEGLPATSAIDPGATVAEIAPLLPDDLVRSYYPLFLKSVLGLSAGLNRRVAEGQRIAYAGVPGAFACVAAGRIFPDGTLCPYADFSLAYAAVEAGECDAAVLPLENSFAGDVAQVMDLAYFGSLYINGVWEMRVSHCLAGVVGASTDTVRTVVSHPQALSQCAPFLSARGYILEEETNTAVAASRVAERRDPTVAAICSPEAAALLGLTVLAANINEDASNTTRFAVMSRVPHHAYRSDACFILTFTVRNEAGALAKAIGTIGAHGFNMRSLRSRPTKKLPWSNFFFLEAEGNLASGEGQRMLEELSLYVSGLKILGSFETRDKGGEQAPK